MTRRTASYLLCSVALVILGLSGAVHPFIAPLCLCWLAIDYAVIRRAGVRLPEVALALLHMWLGVVFLVFAFLGERGPTGSIDLLELLLGFAAPFLLLKLASPPSRLNDATLVLGCVVLTLGSAAFAPGSMPLLILVLFLGAACLFIPPLARRDGAVVPSLRISIVRGKNRWRWAAPVLAIALALGGLLLGSTSYLFVPRMSASSPRESTAHGVARRAKELRTGFSSEVRLGDIGRIKRNPRIAFEARIRRHGRAFDPTKAQRLALLLRARAWEHYDPSNASWVRSVGGTSEIGADGRLSRGNAPLDWQMEMKGYDGLALFLPQHARRIRSADSDLRRDPAGSVFASSPLQSYGVESGDPISSIRDLVSQPERAWNKHLFVVPDELRPALEQAFAAFRVDGRRNSTFRDRADAVGRFFTQSSFRYTLDLPASLPKDMDPVVAFLERKEGHCELFASVACFLLRLQGVPTRMAGGVRLAERIGPGHYRARYRNAHAWIEVQCKDKGFVALDFTPPDTRAVLPTSVDGTDDETGAALAIEKRRAANRESDTPAQFDWSNPLQYSPSDQARFRARVSGLVDAIPFRAIGAGALLLLFFVAARSSLRRARKSALRVNGAATQSRAMYRFYTQWLRRCGANGFRRKPQQTPREFLSTLPDALREEGVPLTNRFEQLRYGTPE